ncbi:MAG: hypothetical protein ABJA67_09585 [Chthonomonadales bacterium]
MKKPFLIAVMSILIGLLYVTSMAVRKQTDPTPEPPPTPPPTTSTGAQSSVPPMKPDGTRPDMNMEHHEATQALEEKKHRAEMMAQQKAHPIKSSTQMDLTSDWDRHRKPGPEGVDLAISAHDKVKAEEQKMLKEKQGIKPSMPENKAEQKMATPVK